MSPRMSPTYQYLEGVLSLQGTLSCVIHVINFHCALLIHQMPVARQMKLLFCQVYVIP